jgi:PAS domain S-box-containing protein
MNDKVSSEKVEVLISSNESKRIEDALRESEEMYRSIVELTPDGIVTVNLKGVVTSCNPATTRISGFSKDEIVGKHISKLGFLRAKDIPKYLKMFSSILRGKVPEPFEITWQSKDGTPHLADVLVSLIKRKGKTIGIQAMVRDITERKKAEEMLRAERDRLEMVTRNIGAGLAIISKDYRTLWANEVLKQMFGDVEGKICYSTYNQRNEICPRCGVREILETGKNKVVYEQVGKGVDGKAVWSEISATPIKDKDGNITAVLELVVPITERKQLEEAIKESQERLKNMFAASPDAITVSDPNGNIIECNQATLDLLGFSSREELIGKNGYELIAEKDHQKAKEYLKKP